MCLVNTRFANGGQVCWNLCKQETLEDLAQTDENAGQLPSNVNMERLILAAEDSQKLSYWDDIFHIVSQSTMDGSWWSMAFRNYHNMFLIARCDNNYSVYCPSMSHNNAGIGHLQYLDPYTSHAKGVRNTAF